MAILACLVLWAGYLGQFAVAVPDPQERAILEQMPPPAGGLARVVYGLYRSDIRLPAVSYLVGFFSQYVHGAAGHANYLWGELRHQGWWYYFPVALAVKTPLPALALWGLGAAAWWRRRTHGQDAVWVLVAPAVLLVLSTRSNINIGLRHVLLVYPLAAIAAGAAVQWCAHRRGRVAVVVCAGALLLTTLRAHPHYLPYFNAAAGGARGGHRVLVDSNLDWGQDLDALVARADAEGWHPLHVQYFGPPHRLDYVRGNLSPLANPCAPTPGYVAVSVTHRVGAYMPEGAACFAWLDAYEPIARVNHSIWVYHIPEDEAADGPA